MYHILTVFICTPGIRTSSLESLAKEGERESAGPRVYLPWRRVADAWNNTAGVKSAETVAYDVGTLG